MSYDGDITALMRNPVFNHSPQWEEAKPPHATSACVGHRRQLGSNDTELVNAYGIDAVEITVLASTLPKAPAKFDKFTVNGQNHIVQDVRQQIGFGGTVLLYRAYCKGH